MLKNNLSSKLDKVLGKVLKPARYIGCEPNSYMKNEGDYELNFALCFPDTYEIGMSSMGISLLYDILNKTKSIFCERVFAPGVDMALEMKKNDIPLFTLETKRDIKECDIVGFSISYELSYTNILYMLDLANIPFLAKDRDESFPLIVAGGPCCYNPEPFADFFDLIMIGDGEFQLVAVCEKYSALKKQGLSKKEILNILKDEIPGIYIPSLANDVTRAFLDDINKVDFPSKQIVPLLEVVHDRAVIELFRGCSRGCRFCQAGMIYRPVRERNLDTNIKLAKEQIDNLGHSEISLLSLSSSDYTKIRELVSNLCVYCQERNVSISLPSLRLDNFDFDMLEKIQGVKKTGLTFACEAGTQRLRDAINKNVTEEDLLRIVKKAVELGWNSIKLYFMCGLPTETYEDLDGIAFLAEKISNTAYEYKTSRGRFNVNISLSNFVPKPFTPFQWVKQDSYDELEKKHQYLKEKIAKIKGVSLRYHDSFVSKLEAVFARGDRSLSALLVKAYEKGAKFDAWTESFNENVWDEALKEFGIDDNHPSLAGFNIDEKLPWDHINSGIDKDYLIKEYNKSLSLEKTKDCRYGCNGCGINKYCDCKFGGIYE